MHNLGYLLDKERKERIRRYEFSQAINSYELAQQVTTTEIAKEICWYMNVTGLLNSCCIGGAVMHIGSDSPFEFSVFLNSLPNFGDNIQRFLSGMFFYHFVRRPGYSNGITLLKHIMPSSSKPCIFSYRLLAESEELIKLPSNDFNEYSYALIDIDIIEHYGFTEIQTIINHEVSLVMKTIFEQDIFKEQKAIFGKLLRNKVESSKQRNKPKSCFSIKLFDKVDSESLGIFSESTFETLKRNIVIKGKNVNVEQTCDFLKNKLLNLRGEVSLINALKESNNEEHVISAIALSFVEFEKVVYFPATYYLENKSQADDAILLYYTSEINAQDLKYEYHKLSELYRNINWANTSYQGNKSISNDFGHEIRHLGSFVKKTCLFLERSSNKLASECLIPFRDCALDYIDLWAKSDKKDEVNTEILVQIEEIVRDSIYLGFIRRFYNTELNLMIKYVDLLGKLFNERILVSINCSENLLIPSKYNIALEKALKTIINNAVYHVLPSKVTFKDLIHGDEVYKILFSYKKNHDSNTCQINVYNQVSLNNLDIPKNNFIKEIGSLKVVRSQMKEIGGNAFMEMIETEQYLSKFQWDEVQAYGISIPFYLSTLQY